ncbi:hypothetical protein GCM10027051_12080 [Niabella terrae]
MKFIIFLLGGSLLLQTRIQAQTTAPADPPTTARPVQRPKNADHSQGNGRLFFAELKDGSRITGSGQIKIREGVAILELQNAEGRTRSLRPEAIKSLSQQTAGGRESLINFENQYWLCKLHRNVERFYQTNSPSDLLFIEDQDRIRAADREEVTGLVKNNKAAYKLARKGKLKKALEVYIGMEDLHPDGPPRRQDPPAKRPLFNTQ